MGQDGRSGKWEGRVDTWNSTAYRDLKPANIMVDEHGQPVIMDFGLARQLDGSTDVRMTQQGELIGTPAYMSPEQVRADRDNIGPASDI